jgi:nucleotide-binding universal stress UspA family protein
MDGGRLAPDALGIGRRWAERFAARLCVVAIEGEHQAELAGLDDGSGGIVTAVRTVGASGELVPTVVELVVELVSSAAAAAVCVAAQAHSPLVDVLSDDVAQQILRAVEIPVVLVGPHCRAAPVDGPLVVAHDGTPASDVVVDVARVWSSALGVPPVLLHVRGSLVAEPRDATTVLEAALRRLGPLASLHTVHSSFPAGAIREYVHEVDAQMVAVTTRGRTGMLTASTGQTATWVVRESPCPVLVVHPPSTVGP